jgi:hypothetical protein
MAYLEILLMASVGGVTARPAVRSAMAKTYKRPPITPANLAKYSLDGRVVSANGSSAGIETHFLAVLFADER